MNLESQTSGLGFELGLGLGLGSGIGFCLSAQVRLRFWDRKDLVSDEVFGLGMMKGYKVGIGIRFRAWVI